MGPDEFVDNFSEIVSAPNGVKRIRELIFQLAVQGRIVEQRSDEEPARALLERLAIQRMQLTAEAPQGRWREFENKHLPDYSVPQSWQWANLAQVGILNPKNEADDHMNAGFSPMALVPNDYFSQIQYQTRRWGEIKKGFTHFSEGDVVLAKITPCFENGKSAVIKGCPNGIGAGTTELHVIRPFNGVNPYYILLYLKSPMFIREGIPLMAGLAGHKRVPLEYFAGRAFPLPPRNEQDRIVHAVEKLIRLCDVLEASRARLNEVRQKAMQVSLSMLATSETPDSLTCNWRRVDAHFNDLIESEKGIDAFARTILDLSFRGRLHKSMPSDSVDELLNAIRKDKKQLTNRRSARRAVPLIENEPAPLPSSARWCHLSDLCTSIADGDHLPPPRSSTGIPFLVIGDVRHGKLEFGRTRRVPRDYYNALEETRKPKREDVLYTVVGSFGIPVKVETDIPFCVQRHIAILKPSKHIDADYIYYMMKSNIVFEQAANIATGIAQKTVPIRGLRDILVPIYPLREQTEIVATIKRLLGFCDQLTAQVNAGANAQDKLCSSATRVIHTDEPTLLVHVEDSVTVRDKLSVSVYRKTPYTNILVVETMKRKIEDTVLARIIAELNEEIDAKNLWQKSGLSIDEFYATLKQEIDRGFIEEPTAAELRLVEVSDL